MGPPSSAITSALCPQAASCQIAGKRVNDCSWHNQDLLGGTFAICANSRRRPDRHIIRRSQPNGRLGLVDLCRRSVEIRRMGQSDRPLPGGREEGQRFPPVSDYQSLSCRAVGICGNSRRCFNRYIIKRSHPRTRHLCPPARRDPRRAPNWRESTVQPFIQRAARQSMSDWNQVRQAARYRRINLTASKRSCHLQNRDAGSEIRESAQKFQSGCQTWSARS